MAAFAIQTQAKGETLYVKAEIGLDMRIRLSLVVNPEAAPHATEAAANRWAAKVARIDPDLALTVVPIHV